MARKFKMESICLLTLLCPFSLPAEIFSLQVRGGNLYPSSDLLKEIYVGNKIEAEVEGALYIPFTNIGIWTNFNGLQKDGHSIDDGEKTEIEIYPLSSGLKFSLSFLGVVCPYVGAGVSYTWLRAKDETFSWREHVQKESLGGVIKSGAIFYLTNRFYSDVFADYYFTTVSASEGHQQVGGLRTGVGVGIAF